MTPRPCSDDTNIGIWNDVTDATITVEEGFISYPALANFTGDTIFTSGAAPKDYYAISMWQSAPLTLSLVADVSSSATVARATATSLPNGPGQVDRLGGTDEGDVVLQRPVDHVQEIGECLSGEPVKPPEDHLVILLRAV